MRQEQGAGGLVTPHVGRLEATPGNRRGQEGRVASEEDGNDRDLDRIEEAQLEEGAEGSPAAEDSRLGTTVRWERSSGLSVRETTSRLFPSRKGPKVGSSRSRVLRPPVHEQGVDILEEPGGVDFLRLGDPVESAVSAGDEAVEATGHPVAKPSQGSSFRRRRTATVTARRRAGSGDGLR